MDKKTGIIIGVLVASFVALIGVSIYQSGRNAVDYSQYDFDAVLEPSEDSGEIGEMIMGDPDAPVKIFEYGDYHSNRDLTMTGFFKCDLKILIPQPLSRQGSTSALSITPETITAPKSTFMNICS